MAYQGTPVVYNHTLKVNHSTIQVGSFAWFQWLDTVDAFSYQHPRSIIRLTIRKERRRHQFYWYAYTKYDNKLHNAYVGSSQYLTHERLVETLDKINDKIRLFKAKGLSHDESA